jgi:protocatechuate 3,4-dioxygenase beta subunit
MSYVSPSNSKLLYGTKPDARADGLARIAIKARLLDEKNKPVAGRLVEFAADREGIIIEQPTQPTGADGLAVGFVSAVTPGPVNISASAALAPQSSDSATVEDSASSEPLS